MTLQNLVLSGSDGLSPFPVLVQPYGGSATVTVGSPGPVYYADSSIGVKVSSTNNQGTILAGGSATFTTDTWITSGARPTPVTITTAGWR